MKPTRILTLAALAAAALAPLSAQTRRNVLDIKESITDSNIIFPESFENSTQRLLEGWYIRNYTSVDPTAPDPGNPQVSDDVIRRRLAALPTVIEMPFNQIVRACIDRYTAQSRPQLSVILGLANYYMPIFEQALEERGLPMELKYIPVIESGLDPNAVSSHGAAGLWQFMPATGKGMGLEVNSVVDQRRDPYAASAAAADYLRSLHDTYKDWNLVIAAYNCGPGAVNKAIRRAGAAEGERRDFWSIYEYLSPETRSYVPMFIAANYVMNHYRDHGLQPVLPTKPLVTDTIHVTDRVHFDQISAVLDIPLEELRLLNPQYRADVIPASAEHPYSLTLPSLQTQAYIVSEDEILAYEADRYARRDEAEPGDETPLSVEPEIVLGPTPVPDKTPLTVQQEAGEGEGQSASASTQTVVHKVAAGETLAQIAQQYGVTVADLRAWNHLRRNAVRAGQSIKVLNPTLTPQQGAKATQQTAQAKPASQAKPAASAAKEAPRKAENQAAKAKKAEKAAAPKSTVHTIVSGESLTSISKKYGVSIDEIKAANGMKDDNLRAGKTLTIPAKKASAGKAPAKKAASKKSTRKGKKR